MIFDLILVKVEISASNPAGALLYNTAAPL
jgi:hypothetical protein